MRQSPAPPTPTDCKPNSPNLDCIKFSEEIQGSYPFSETNFQDFSRTLPEIRLIFQGPRALKFTLAPTLPRSQG